MSKEYVKPKIGVVYLKPEEGLACHISPNTKNTGCNNTHSRPSFGWGWGWGWFW